MKRIDRTGTRYGRLEVLSLSGKKLVCGKSRPIWTCRCDCGRVVEIIGIRLTQLQSCGCLRLERVTTHGETKSLEYRIWMDMVRRCRNPKNKRFKDYGGRGISVSERWMRFENFLSDMGRRPSSNLSIDRIDNNGNYEPGNCKWSTRSEQQHNRRDNRHASA